MTVDPITHGKFTAVDAYARRYTVPFIWAGTGDPSKGVVGSGVLLEIDGRRFVITAAHVLEEIQDAERKYGDRIEWGLPTARSSGVWDPSAVHYPGDMVIAGAEPNNARIDVGLVELKNQVLVEMLVRERGFLTLDDIDFQLRDADYFVFGYPAESTVKGATQLHSFPFSFASALRLDPAGWPPNTDPHHNVVLEKPPTACLADGSSVPLPKRQGLQGISGGGTWSVDDASTGVWSPTSQAKLAAVVTRVPDAHDCIVSTRWVYVAAVLKRYDSTLGPSLDAAFARSMRRQQVGQ